MIHYIEQLGSVPSPPSDGGLPDLSRDEEYIQEQLPVQLNSLAEIQNMRCVCV